jgi:DNA mismatch repair protein MutL
MAIQILSPQLANQIAAGEVVERPASVVKELVENSLDAGATSITIDIEKGGSKLIRIRDDGCGIAKDELELALCRHATSKIHQLSDLEQILSLGFRGEALASISSVSRLTLTSRPAEQESAWQAIAEGREMQVQLRPAAHPVGSSIEVLDLFFNTPARRRFLRSDKTEFSHIDELVKRLALSRYDVNWTLTHNGQVIRQLKAATDRPAQEKRLAQLCGRGFIESALYVESQYDDMRLWGWVQLAHACQAQPSCQFSYVNGRMIRDKLLNHAIRQAYGDVLMPGAQPAFVLYLELDPHQLDVNVHPAKHEVRFHQARLVHDFVVSALAQVCQQPALFDVTAADTSSPAAVVVPPAPKQSISIRESSGQYGVHQPGVGAHYSAFAQRPQRALTADSSGDQLGSTRPGAGWPLPVAALAVPEVNKVQAVPAQFSPVGAAHTPWLAAAGRYAVAMFNDKLWLVDASYSLCDLWLAQPPVSSALLLPLRLPLQELEKALLLEHAQHLAELGFDLVLNNNVLIVRAVPQLLRQTAVSQWLPMWWQQWAVQPVSGVRPLLLQLLQSGLQQQWFSLAIFLNYFEPHLSETSDRHAVPLDISASQMVLEAKR